MTGALQILAREVAASLVNPDRKQLRFNEIIECARTFYPNCLSIGIIELVRACDRGQLDENGESTNPAYIKKFSMHEELMKNYGWMK